MKSHVSLILWSSRTTAKCSLLMFGTALVKSGALKAASPAEKSLGAGRVAHSAAIAGLTPFMRGSSVPLSAGSVVPIKGSLSTQGLEHAAGSSVGVGFRLKASTTPVVLSLNFKIPARRAADGTKR